MAKPPATSRLPTSAPPPPRTSTVAPTKPPTSTAPPPASKTTTIAPPVQHTSTSLVALPNTSADLRPSSTVTTIGNNNIANESGGGGGGMGGAAIGGMVAGVVVILVGSVVGGFLLLKQRRKRMMMSGRNARNYNGYPDPDFGSGRVVSGAGGSGSGLGVAPPMPSFRREPGPRPRSAYSAHSRGGSSSSRNSGYGIVPPPPLPMGVRGRVNVGSGVWDEKYYGNSTAAMVTRRVSSTGGNGYAHGEYYPSGPGVPAGESSYSQLHNGTFVANGRRGGEENPNNFRNGGSMVEGAELDPAALEKERQLDQEQQDRIMAQGNDGSVDPAIAASSVSPTSVTAPASPLGPHPFESRPLGAAASAYRASSRAGTISDTHPYHSQNGDYYQPGPAAGYGPQRPYSQAYPSQQHPYAPRPRPPMMNRPMTPSGVHGPYPPPPPPHHFQQQHPYYPPHHTYGPSPLQGFHPQQHHPYLNEMQDQGSEGHYGPRRQPTYSSATMSNGSSTVVDEDVAPTSTRQSPTPRSHSRQQQHPKAGNTLMSTSSQEPVMLLQDAQPLESFAKEEIDHNQEKEPILDSMGEDISCEAAATNGERQEYVMIETNVISPDKVDQEHDRAVVITPPPLPIATKPRSIREF